MLASMAKRDRADEIKLRIWRWGIILDYLQGQTEGDLTTEREDDVMVEAEVGMMCFEDGGRGHKPRIMGGP